MDPERTSPFLLATVRYGERTNPARSCGTRFIYSAAVSLDGFIAGRLDEVLLFVVPLLIGDGVRAFPRRPGRSRVLLEPMADDTPHRYRVHLTPTPSGDTAGNTGVIRRR